MNSWQAFTGKRENRFTADTTSPFGKRQYQSGAWNAYLNRVGAPVGYTARGWYASTGYTNFTFKDSNIGTGKGFQASQLRDTCAPASVTVTYALAKGATHAFLYLDPSLHGGSKGRVIAENQTGSKGSFTFSTEGLASGVHVLLGGGWEKASDGWGAGVARLPIRVCDPGQAAGVELSSSSRTSVASGVRSRSTTLVGVVAPVVGDQRAEEPHEADSGADLV